MKIGAVLLLALLLAAAVRAARAESLDLDALRQFRRDHLQLHRRADRRLRRRPRRAVRRSRLPGRGRRAGPGAGRRGAPEGAHPRHLGEPHFARVRSRCRPTTSCILSENFSAALTPADLVQYRLGVPESRLRAGRQRRRDGRRVSPRRSIGLKSASRALCRAQARGALPGAKRLPHDLLPAERHPDRGIPGERLSVPRRGVPCRRRRRS